MKKAIRDMEAGMVFRWHRKTYIALYPPLYALKNSVFFYDCKRKAVVSEGFLSFKYYNKAEIIGRIGADGTMEEIE